MFGIGSKAKIEEDQEYFEEKVKGKYWPDDFKGN